MPSSRTALIQATGLRTVPAYSMFVLVQWYWLRGVARRLMLCSVGRSNQRLMSPHQYGNLEDELRRFQIR